MTTSKLLGNLLANQRMGIGSKMSIGMIGTIPIHQRFRMPDELLFIGRPSVNILKSESVDVVGLCPYDQSHSFNREHLDVPNHSNWTGKV